jgi:hypothetical protein
MRELAASGAPRLRAMLGLKRGSAEARIRRVAYERIGLAIARGSSPCCVQLLGDRPRARVVARLGCVDAPRRPVISIQSYRHQVSALY